MDDIKNEMIDVTEVVRKIIDCVCGLKGRFGVNKVAGILVGAKSTKLFEIGAYNFESYGTLDEYSESSIKNLMNQLIHDDFLIKTAGGYPVICPGRRIMELAYNDFQYMVNDSIKKKSDDQKYKEKTDNYELMTDSDYELYQLLRDLRKKLAVEEEVPQYRVFSNKTLMNIAVMRPTTLDALINVPGVGEKKIDKYGELILQVIKDKLIS